MSSGGVLPGRDPSVRAEVVHESERTRVTRLFLPGRTVIRKQPLGPDAERRVRHETSMLERLRGVAGVVQLAEAPRDAESVVLGDAGGASLADLGKPLAVADLIGLGLGLGRAVAGMHHRGVMHRDITPANIVVSGDGTPTLVDFALASSLAEIRPEFTHHTGIVGTLAYLAPEQTGRTGRPVDHRADLYALGATLYEMATGERPFGSADPLRLVHDHLARVPVPPAEVNPAIPGPLSAIVMHLLEKEPDNRYQTADGVVYDLERVRDVGAGQGALRVGEHDVPFQLLPPSRLVERDAEVAVLQAAFEEALAGRCRGVLVSGAPGVGKTALADQLRPMVTGAGGCFVAGKFDQYRRDLEFDAVNQALREAATSTGSGSRPFTRMSTLTGTAERRASALSAGRSAVAEALTNIAKYADASAAEVEATTREGVLQVWVRDDGRGGADFGRGSGLAGLKDRIEALGGRISLHSPPGAGTTLQIALPLNGPRGPAWEN